MLIPELEEWRSYDVEKNQNIQKPRCKILEINGWKYACSYA